MLKVLQSGDSVLLILWAEIEGMASLIPGLIFVILLLLTFDQLKGEEMRREARQFPLFLHKKSERTERNLEFFNKIPRNRFVLFDLLVQSLENEKSGLKMGSVGREKKSVSLLNKIYSTGFTPMTYYGGIRTRGGSRELLSPKTSSYMAEIGDFGPNMPRKPGFRLRWGK